MKNIGSKVVKTCKNRLKVGPKHKIAYYEAKLDFNYKRLNIGNRGMRLVVRVPRLAVRSLSLVGRALRLVRIPRLAVVDL